MLLLILFAFIAGVVTILSPCILPILPIVLSGSLSGSKRRPWGIVTGFVLSFTFFTLFLSTLVQHTGIAADSLRTLSIIVIFGLGLSLLIPKTQIILEYLFSQVGSWIPTSGNTEGGFVSGLLLGISLGLLWTPCVGPILASVITLSFTGSISSTAIAITFAYSLGTGLPMLAILYGGHTLLNRVPWLLRNTGRIQKGFGVMMIATAIAIFLNIDRQFQTWVLTTFPNYGTGLTQFEETQTISDQLDRLNRNFSNSDQAAIADLAGKPMNKVVTTSLDKAPELVGTGQWFNSEPLTIAGLQGKVVLVDFWTYSCINCIRTLPYLRDWHAKYADKGLVIIGVHTPEFEFEKSADNLAQAIKDFELTYPIVQDNDYKTWRAYKNRYWPAKYLIDREGQIRYTHFGEGKYQETEAKIQAALAKTRVDISSIELSPDTPSISPLSLTSSSSQTPELYLGTNRIEYLVPNQLTALPHSTSFTLPIQIPPHHFAFSGTWMLDRERAMPAADSSLALEFEAAEVFLVMNPRGNEPAQMRVYLDGQLVSTSQAGADVNRGGVTINKDRLYRLIQLSQPSRHQLRLEFLDDNAELFAFTFG